MIVLNVSRKSRIGATPVKTFQLEREQWIPRPSDEVFAFFADAKNLGRITPPWLNFQIVNPQPTALEAGVQIVYRLAWHGISVHWVTEIQSWHPPDSFVDVQLHGPYRHWRHTHSFQRLNGGTLMRDAVEYALPFGPLGLLAHRWKVKADLDAIFDYRAEKVEAEMRELERRGEK
jgi:ligand-binding SRPBCC domain-containing protein